MQSIIINFINKDNFKQDDNFIFHYAVEHGLTEVVEHLLSLGLSANDLRAENNRALIYMELQKVI